VLQKDNRLPKKEKIGIVGAGPGGLTCAMLLAHKGFDVTVLEKEEKVGGRSASLNIGDFKFDIGPTFLMKRKRPRKILFKRTKKIRKNYPELVQRLLEHNLFSVSQTHCGPAFLLFGGFNFRQPRKVF